MHPPGTLGTFDLGLTTADPDTAFAVLVPPWGGPGAPGVGDVGVPGKQIVPTLGPGVIHVTSMVFDPGGAGNVLTILRPTNWTWFSTGAAAAQKVVNLHDDPGKYSTNYRFPLANGKTAPSTANNLIAGNDYVAYQAANGQYVLDTVASVSGLAVTLTTNLPTGGVLAGGLLFFFGTYSDTDPFTNAAHVGLDTLTGTTRLTYTAPNGLWHGHHAGAPMMFYGPNATDADAIQLITGFYGKR